MGNYGGEGRDNLSAPPPPPFQFLCALFAFSRFLYSTSFVSISVPLLLCCFPFLLPSFLFPLSLLNFYFLFSFLLSFLFTFPSHSSLPSPPPRILYYPHIPLPTSSLLPFLFPILTPCFPAHLAFSPTPSPFLIPLFISLLPPLHPPPTFSPFPSPSLPQ